MNRSWTILVEVVGTLPTFWGLAKYQVPLAMGIQKNRSRCTVKITRDFNKLYPPENPFRIKYQCQSQRLLRVQTDWALLDIGKNIRYNRPLLDIMQVNQLWMYTFLASDIDLGEKIRLTSPYLYKLYETTYFDIILEIDLTEWVGNNLGKVALPLTFRCPLSCSSMLLTWKSPLLDQPTSNKQLTTRQQSSQFW